MRFSAWIRILQKKWSNVVGSRLDFPSWPGILLLRKYAQPSPLWSPRTEISKIPKRILFVHFARKGSRCVKTTPLWPLAKIVGNWGVWRVHLRLTSCLSCHCGIRSPVFPFPLFSQPYKGRARDPFMRAFVRAFANYVLSELKILRFVNLIGPCKTCFIRAQLQYYKDNTFFIFLSFILTFYSGYWIISC